MSRAPVIAALFALAACGDRKPTPKATVDEAPSGRLVGIDPERWGCEVVITPAAVGEVLGGPVRQVDGSLGAPRGVAKPCNYLLTTATSAESWTVDFDCRKNALATAELLWTQYRDQNQALIEAAADAGKDALTDDAGVVHGPPPPATEVEVGAKGLDHNGQALLFVDDDAPCYARIAGPDPARRLALAKLVAKNLRPETAPMEPRAAGK